ncbi:sodium:proton antiporter [Sphingomonas koreensis]|nr:sodium:proton antiporter [Sphingomonas koreensis]
MQGFDFQTLGALLFVAALVAMASRRLDLPYSVGLVTAGIALALLAPGVSPPLTHDLIYYVFLPPLVFEAAIQIPWQPLRREMPLLLALVTLGVVLAAGVVAIGMHLLEGWSWIGAGLFGVLIAATDPVAVIAAFKAMKVEPRLHLLVEAESLLNDGVAAVGFAVLLGIAASGTADPGAIGLNLLVTIVGGLASGAIVALPLIVIAGRTTDRLVEITLTMLIAYGAFLLAEHFHASGVLATLTAGLIVGNYGFLGSISDDGRSGVLHHWEFSAFLINSLIFILIGGLEATMPILAVIEAAAIATLLSLAGRAAAVYPVVAAFARSHLAVPARYQHVLFWGGLRGALALALALTLPASIPERGEIIVVAFAVVAFSIFVQGLTMPWLIRKLGLTQREGGEATGD